MARISALYFLMGLAEQHTWYNLFDYTQHTNKLELFGLPHRVENVIGYHLAAPVFGEPCELGQAQQLEEMIRCCIHHNRPIDARPRCRSPGHLI